jgi:hypothetical protein
MTLGKHVQLAYRTTEETQNDDTRVEDILVPVSPGNGLPVAIVDYGQPAGWRYAVPTQTATTVMVCGVLHSIVINTTAAATITLYDGPSAALGTKFATLKASIAEGTYFFDVALGTGKLTLVLAGASDITVTYA